MTPEGKVKEAVKRLIKPYQPDLYYEMPVPSGFGKSGLDFEGVFRGRAFSIETKKPGAKPTPRQLGTINAKARAGAFVFVIDGGPGTYEFERLRSWLQETAE